MGRILHIANKKILCFILLLVIIVSYYFFSRVYVVGETKDGILFLKHAYKEMPITLEYRHSVQRTMIYEYLEVDENLKEIVLKSTKYQSYGAGLPFSSSDGHFRKEKDWFILENINRKFKTLSIRNGVINEEKVHVGDEIYSLKDEMPIGKELRIYVAPLYKVIF